MLETPKPIESSASTEVEPVRPPTSTRDRAALGLAVIALVAALVGAIGPAERVRTTYSWPPETLPAGSPAQLWYTPLLLAAHRPETIEARVPCNLPRALAPNEPSTTVLATARRPQENGGLFVARIGDRLTVGIGESVLQRLALPPRDARSDCAFHLRLSGTEWSIDQSPGKRKYGGTFERIPRVSGLFSGLDLQGRDRPSIEITTSPHDTKTIARQTVAWIIAVVALAIALFLAAFEHAPRRSWSGAAGPFRRAIANAHPADAVVAIVLLGWWVIAPIGFDDGWVQAREQMFSSSGGFSLYYNTLGANLPLDYWVEWGHHWLAEATSALVFLRIPTLLCLAATWTLCRWIVGRVTSSIDGPEPIVLWSLTCAFLVGALAWGMTLRPEPVTALLVIGVTACMVRFLESETAVSVAAAAVLIALALAAHTTGVVALAPVIVAGPRLFRWARSHAIVAATIVVASSALLAVLVFVGSDLEQRRLDVQLSTIYSQAWQADDAFSRYAALNVEPAGTPIRRIAVGLIMLAALAFVLRQRRSRAGLLDFPAPVLAVAGVLLFATPSKWAWHFGALIGVGAVAVACETARIRVEVARSSKWNVWPFLAVAAAGVFGYWAWWESHPWNPVDLRTLIWYPGLANALSTLAILLPIFLILIACLVALIRGRGDKLHAVPWRIASWSTPLLTLPAVAYTVGILIIDSARAGTWTLARQNLQTIVGDAGCGLADDLLIPISSSARALPGVEIGPAPPVPAWVPAAPVARLARFALSPVARRSSQSQWSEISTSGRAGVFVAGIPGPSDHLSLEWGRMRRGRVEVLRADEFTRVVREFPGTTPWRFFASGELPRPSPGATLMRVSFRAGAAPGSAIAVTAPVVYRNEPLATVMNRAGSRSLVYPELLPYIPCTQLPLLREGTVEVPQYVAMTDSLLLRERSSPFIGLGDLYTWDRLSLSDTKDWPDRVLLFRVDQSIPGAELAAPDKAPVTS